MIYLLFIGGIGEIGEKSKFSASFRRFFIGGKIAFIGGKGQKARFSASFVAFPDSLPDSFASVPSQSESFRVFYFVKRCGVPSAAGYY